MIQPLLLELQHNFWLGSKTCLSKFTLEDSSPCSRVQEGRDWDPKYIFIIKI